MLHPVLVHGVGGLAVLANLIDARANAPSVCFPLACAHRDHCPPGDRRVGDRCLTAAGSVSRTFLYENPDARTLVGEAIAKTVGRQIHARAGTVAQQEAARRQRALNAEDSLKVAHAEIPTQRAGSASFSGSFATPTTRRCAGRTGLAGRSRRCGAPPDGATCDSCG